MHDKMEGKFVCRQCGQCCSHIQGLISERDREFLKEYAYGKLPIISLLPIEKTSFPLWDFEAKRFLKGAEENGIDGKIKPARVIFDLNENRTIVVTYSIDSDSCTFLKGGKCVIYGQRAFICRLFPFQHTPFLKMEGDVEKENMFGSCPAILDIIENLEENDKEKMIKSLHESFGDVFLAAVQHDMLTEWMNKKTMELVKRKIIKPALDHPYKFILKRIESSEKIDFTDYLVEKNIYSRRDIDEIITKNEAFFDAKEMIGIK